MCVKQEDVRYADMQQRMSDLREVPVCNKVLFISIGPLKCVGRLPRYMELCLSETAK